MKRVIKFLLCVVFGILLIILFTYVTQILWNWLVPTLFNGPIISFYQTLGLLILSKIIFSGFGGKGSKCEMDGNPWKEKMKEKFSHMSAEERETFKQKMREKWCSTMSDKPQKPESEN